jgi:WD40 repeat protein
MMKATLALAAMLCLGLASARAQDRPEVFPQLGHFGEVFGLAISPDGAMVASSGGDNAVRIWETATVREIGTLGQRLDAMELAFSPGPCARRGYDRRKNQTVRFGKWTRVA